MTSRRYPSSAFALRGNTRRPRSALLHGAPDHRSDPGGQFDLGGPGRRDLPPPAAGFGRRLAQLLFGTVASLAAGAMAGALLWFVSAPGAGPTLPGASVPGQQNAGAPLITAAGADDVRPSQTSEVFLAVATPLVVARKVGLDVAEMARVQPAATIELAKQIDPAFQRAEPVIEQITQNVIQLEALPYTEPLPSDQADGAPRLRNGAALDAALAALDLAALAPNGVSLGAAPPWQRYAAASAATPDRPMIAVVIDDLGLNRPNAYRTISLPPPLTLALMTYSDGLQALADAARSAGHELLLHVPMAPRDANLDPGPNALREDLGPVVLGHRLDWALSRFDGFVGINNHMGSRFTTSVPGMAQVMMQLKARGLLYLDSLTVAESLGGALAKRLGVPYAERDIFIDNEPEDRAAIRRQLQALEEAARRDGQAVGIGHPHDLTLEELARWIPEVQARGFKLVPITAVIRLPG